MPIFISVSEPRSHSGTELHRGFRTLNHKPPRLKATQRQSVLIRTIRVIRVPIFISVSEPRRHSGTELQKVFNIEPQSHEEEGCSMLVVRCFFMVSEPQRHEEEGCWLFVTESQRYNGARCTEVIKYLTTKPPRLKQHKENPFSSVLSASSVCQFLFWFLNHGGTTARCCTKKMVVGIRVVN